MSMRILVVSHGHPSFSLGGAEVASYNLHKGFQANSEVDTHYLARVGAPTPRHAGTALMSLRQRGGELLYYAEEYDHFLLSNRATDEIERDFVRVLRDLKPDVVHFHHFIGLGLECIFAVRDTLPDALIVVTFHEYLSICHHHGQMVKTGAFKLCYRSSPSDCNACFPDISPSRFLARETFIKGILNLADHFISPSRFLAERYQQWGLSAERFSVIENGIDVAEVAPPRPGPEANGRRSRFAYFGQLTPYKGADVLIDAVTRIPEQVWGEDSVLLVYGGNLDRQPEAYKKKFTDLVEAAGRRVRFCGPFQNHEMPNLMRSVDWVVMPSVWWENSPIVIQEAFFHGRPILSSNLGGMAEKITDEVDGLHFRSGSPEDLVDCMTRALSEPGLWERLRAGIKKPLSHVDCAEQHLALYQRLIAERGVTTPANRAAAPMIA
ncbi:MULTISPECIES: glycosyltransferase family 4 protein [unclassified Bosea (in: a-proteobacteria)]|uniref:glycosyltransferase family 4 protein n=1 Tax=unclassified Bosea (in: a-proteobacteria) TaxID=2653178 RepID=UPI00125FD283|nr:MULTISPECIES: glycosyltransferase family 4 protein [unclassified Bosea (in: a-proteobacteria)]